MEQIAWAVSAVYFWLSALGRLFKRKDRSRHANDNE